MSDAVGTADKFLLGFFGFLVYHYGCDFCKTMIWDIGKEDKSKDKERREWIIDNSLLSIDGNIAEMNEKLSDIQKKVTLLYALRRPQPGAGLGAAFPEKGKIEYDEVDFGVHTPEVRHSG